MSSSLGTLFRISTWGESHGGAVGVVVDGCPPRIPISLDEIQFELDRRRPGQSKIVSQRKPRVFGLGKGKLTILKEDDEYLKDFEEYMP